MGIDDLGEGIGFPARSIGEMRGGFTDSGEIVPAVDFPFEEIDDADASSVQRHRVHRIVEVLTSLIAWARTGADIAAVRAVLQIDRRRPVEIARQLGISRQAFNHSLRKARSILEG